jgi:hypothetical protein
MKFIIYILTIFTAMCAGCDPAIDDMPHQNVVVVLCDVSTSVNKRDKDTGEYRRMMNTMAMNCKKLICSYTPPTYFLFFAVNDNISSSPLEFNTTDILVNTEDQQIAEIETFYSELKKYLFATSANSKNNTCLFSAIENSLRLFSDLSDHKEYAKANKELVIFSDMMEVCRTAPMGKIHFDELHSEKPVSDTDKAKLSSYNYTGAKFDDMNVNVKIYLSVPEHLQSTLETNQLESAWQIIFTKYGYSKATNHNLFINVPTLSAVHGFEKVKFN